MTPAEKIGFVELVRRGRIENINSGVPALCIPPLTLVDGPNGLAFDLRRVTQLPASIALAATFDPTLAYAYGQVLGDEARSKGFDAVQAPELNLAQVAQSGRVFEAFGEDPLLTSVMGVADAEGLQSRDVMADAKHFTAYNQETDRATLREVVSQRALVELYDRPFQAVVTQAHVASVMCAYGVLNGVNDCSDPSLYRLLRSWGFAGFVRSDLGAVTSPAAAFRAGLDLIKPSSTDDTRVLMARAANEHSITQGMLDAAIARVLTEMFAFGLIAHPRTPDLIAPAATPADALTALRVAERSAVLLKNADGLLPLASSPGSVAIIGVDAEAQAVTAGEGSSYVNPPFLITPLAALRNAFGKRTRIKVASGAPSQSLLPPIPQGDFVSGGPLPSETLTDKMQEEGRGHLAVDAAGNVALMARTASSPGQHASWWSWKAVIRVPRSGVYEFSLQQSGDTRLVVDGHTVLASPGLVARPSWSTTIELDAGRLYALEVEWFAVNGRPLPQLGLEDVSPFIARAVGVARTSRVALVFVGDLEGEGVDRPSLDLPGDANALVDAVAGANPRTVVVLNTGGAVLMPWLAHVKAVLEAWYPGEEDGAAVAAILLGRVDPSGRLPLTFPATNATARAAAGDGFPGANGTVRYSSGLDIGYRWYEARGVRPLFPFGYGLSYTSFALSRVSLRWTGTSELASLTVTNTGRRSGTDVVQVYVSFPASAGEPPRQLAGFQPVTLDPGASRQVTVTLPLRSFEAFLGGHLRIVHGNYRLGFGSSSVALPLWLTTTVPPATPRVPLWAELVIVLAVIVVLGTVGYRLGAKTTRAARAARRATTATGQARLPQ
jgi:beta-glucosidase